MKKSFSEDTTLCAKIMVFTLSSPVESQPKPVVPINEVSDDEDVIAVLKPNLNQVKFSLPFRLRENFFNKVMALFFGYENKRFGVSGDLNMKNHKITNLRNPTTNSEPVTKSYADTHYSSGSCSGAQGPKGDKGDRGARGPKGNTGAQGSKADKGDTGSRRPIGDPGSLEQKVIKATVVHEDLKKIKVIKGIEVHKVLREILEAQDHKEFVDIQVHKVQVDYKVRKETKEIKERRETKGNRVMKDYGVIQVQAGYKAQRETREIKEMLDLLVQEVRLFTKTLFTLKATLQVTHHPLAIPP